MDALSTRGGGLLNRREVPLACFGVSAVLAVYLGFIGISVKLAEDLVKRGGYYVMLVTFALFLHAVWRIRQAAPWKLEPLTRGQRWGTVAIIAVLSSMAITAEPYCSKILNDEFVLQSTAFNMHYFRDVVTMVRGYEIQGVFLSTDNYLDKRPYFYPFLVSLLHDLTGYRVANAFVVNSLLMPIALALAFAFGRCLGGWRGGLLAVLLLGSLPLLGQNATGSGMELVNTTMILATLLLATIYLAQPDEARLAALVFAAILLAQSRYESALYALAVAVVIALGWLRERRVILPWAAVAGPLLLLPVALQNKVLSHSPILWELNEKTAGRFDFSYLPENLRGAIAFLFNRSVEHANSLTLSTLGVLALGWCLWRLARSVKAARAGLTSDPARTALVCFSAVIVANTLLVFCYYWSRFNDPMASRFSLPLHLLLTFAVVLAAIGLDRRGILSRALLLFVGLFAVAGAAAKFGLHHYSHLGIDEVEWQRRYVNALPSGERLIISNQSTLPWLLEKKPSILIGRARMVADRLHAQLQEPNLDEILVVQTLRPSTPDGDHQIPPDDKLPATFTLETLAERRFGTRICRISRLTAVELPRGTEKAGESSSPTTRRAAE